MSALRVLQENCPIATYMGELCVFGLSGRLVCLLALTETLDCVVGFSE